MIWTPPRAIGRLDDNERFVMDTAIRLGCSHMLLPARYAERVSTRDLMFELYWRAIRAISGWFTRKQRPATTPEVAELRAEMLRARSAKLAEIEPQFHGPYLRRFLPR